MLYKARQQNKTEQGGEEGAYQVDHNLIITIFSISDKYKLPYNWKCCNNNN